MNNDILEYVKRVAGNVFEQIELDLFGLSKLDEEVTFGGTNAASHKGEYMSERSDYFFAEFDRLLRAGSEGWYALCMASDAYKKVFYGDTNKERARGSMAHELKTWPKYFNAMRSGEKGFELRVNDRDFQVGDALRLNEWDPDRGDYTGRFILRKVTYLIQGDFGLPDNVCAMSVCRISPEEFNEATGNET